MSLATLSWDQWIALAGVVGQFVLGGAAIWAGFIANRIAKDQHRTGFLWQETIDLTARVGRLAETANALTAPVPEETRQRLLEELKEGFESLVERVNILEQLFPGARLVADSVDGARKTCEELEHGPTKRTITRKKIVESFDKLTNNLRRLPSLGSTNKPFHFQDSAKVIPKRLSTGRKKTRNLTS